MHPLKIQDLPLRVTYVWIDLDLSMNLSHSGEEGQKSCKKGFRNRTQAQALEVSSQPSLHIAVNMLGPENIFPCIKVNPKTIPFPSFNNYYIY